MHISFFKSTALSAALAGIACLAMAQPAEAQTVPPIYPACSYANGFGSKMPPASQIGNNTITITASLGSIGSTNATATVHVSGRTLSGSSFGFNIYSVC